jgi:diphosphomevalonate decarboxylase
MKTGRARARSNMALVKYWGKRDEPLILPFTGSISMTLDALSTETEVAFTGAAGPDVVELDGAAAAQGETGRVSALLDLVRERSPGLGAARVTTRNSFPTAGGLASSASGFAALAAAATWAAEIDADPVSISILARRGSGSACRSVLGGFVEWVRGERPDGRDSVAKQVLGPSEWDVAIVIAIVETGRKDTSSRDAMQQSVLTSPFFDAWVRTTGADLDAARSAVLSRDIERLGSIAERSFLKMHATAMTSDPPALFWKPPTLDLIAVVRRLRESGVGAWATIDAGPHVAALCRGPDASRVEKVMAAVAGVRQVVTARPGPGVERL